MMTFVQDLAVALQPVVIEACALLLTALLGWVAVQAKRRLGLDIEARHRDALHSAVMSGVRAALDGSRTKQQLLDEAVAYIRLSVPDAVKALAAEDGMLRQLAEAKLAEVLGPRGAVTA